MYANINNISYLIEILKCCLHFMSEEYEVPRSLKIFQEKNRNIIPVYLKLPHNQVEILEVTVIHSFPLILIKNY